MPRPRRRRTPSSGRAGAARRAVATVRKTGVADEATFDVEDLSTAFLRLDGGGTLLLESSWAQWIPEDQCYVTVYGSEGGASIEWGAPSAPGRTLEHLDREGRRAGRALHPEMPPDGGHRECVRDFLEHGALRRRRQPPRLAGAGPGRGRRRLLCLGRIGWRSETH